VFPSWVKTRRRINTVQPQQIAVPYQKTLNDMAGKLKEEGTSEEDIRKLSKELETLNTQITKDVLDNFLSSLGAFQTEVEQWRASPPKLDAELDAALEAEVLTKITEARSAAGIDMNKARSSFEKSRLSYVRLLAQNLQKRLLTPPQGMAGDEWNKIAADVRNKMESVKNEKDVDKAFASYQQGYEEFTRQLEPMLKPAKGIAGHAGIKPVSDVRVVPHVSKFEAPVEPFGRSYNVGDIVRKMALYDVFFTLVILLISVLLGLKLLWVDDPTWGGAKAYMTALLWGLGLHQVSGVAFEGVTGLVARWSKP